MKICHVIYIPRLSGAEILVRDLALVHSRENHEISIISIKPLQDSFKETLGELVKNGVKTYFPDNEYGKFKRFAFIRKALIDIKADVLILHSVIPGLYIRFLQKIFYDSTPTILVLHDASQDDYQSFYFRCIERFLVNSPSYLIGLSQRAIDNYKNRNRKKISSKIIKNGIFIENILSASKNRENTRKTVFNVLDESEIIFLQVGRISPVKQQHLSLAAFKEASSYFTGRGRLFFVGISEDKEYEINLIENIKKERLDKLVYFLGERSDIPDLLGGADVYLMPSQDEANSIAMLEAIASGIKVIANDIYGFREYRDIEGVNLINCSDINLYSRYIYESIGSSSKRHMNRSLVEYSINITAKKYIKIFNKLD